jgi:hypothetical protein
VDLAALIIAIVSLVIAGASASWQVAEYLLTGGRPRATLQHGTMDRGGAYLGEVKRDGRKLDISTVHAQGLGGKEVLAVEVVNHGRSQVTVAKYALCTEGGSLSYRPVGDTVGPELPFRLQAGESATWYVDMDDVDALAGSEVEVLKNRPRAAYIEVTLGTGKTVRTKRSLRV